MPSLNWIGKHAVVNHHKEIPFRLLKCRDDLSAGDSDSGNLLVQGDNLEALKALLPYYAGQVKCIFIDPPYNTGNEGWVYNDAVNSPEMRDWLGRVVGGESEDLSRHDKWLCMMYPRLALLRELLSEDGSLWMSIDDNEVHFARAVMEEVFGAQNFVSQIAWQKVYSVRMDAKGFSKDYDTLLVFQKSDKFHPRKVMFEQNKAQFSLFDEAAQRYYRRRSWRKEGSGSRREDRPNLFYEIPTPDGSEVLPIRPDGSEGRWRGDMNHFNELDDAGQIEWVQAGDTWQIYVKQYYIEGATQPPSTVWLHEDSGNNHEAIEELKRIFGQAPFQTPKPVRLIQKIIQIASSPGDLVLDSFAGSGTTGHAVLKQNAEDGGNRRFILVEMDTNIAPNITAERLRRVIRGYTHRDQRGNERSEPGLGGGFRFCDLGATLFDPAGPIRKEVSYEELAQHIYFIETGSPLPRTGIKQYPLLGINNNQAVYLLYNGVLKDKSPQGGNVLTYAVLDTLPPHNGPMIIYGTGSRISDVRLDEMGIIFKQIPYEIKAN
jgi:DNA modification methylase